MDWEGSEEQKEGVEEAEEEEDEEEEEEEEEERVEVVEVVFGRAHLRPVSPGRLPSQHLSVHMSTNECGQSNNAFQTIS